MCDQFLFHKIFFNKDDVSSPNITDILFVLPNSFL